MKRIVLLAAMLFGMLWCSTPSAHALTLEDIVNMSNIGVADTVIIAAIEASDTVFNLTAADIIELTRVGVSQSVIEALQKTARRPAQSAPNSPPPSVTPTAPDPPPSAVREPVQNPPPPRTAPQTAPATQPQQALSQPRSTSIPLEVRNLKTRYDTGKYNSAAVMAHDLLVDPAAAQLAPFHPTIFYYLGKSLFKLRFYHAAHVAFLQVLSIDTTRTHFAGCLSMLVQTSEKLKDYDGLYNVLLKVDSDDLPRKVKNSLLYGKGLRHYENNDYEDARASLDLVASSSEFYAQAQLVLGMTLFHMGRNREAVRVFRDLVQGRQFVGNPSDIRAVQDLAVLNMARIYYRVEDFERAEMLYELVPRDSRYWPQALYESAYANFWQEDYNVSLGLLLTLDSPFISGKYYLPDADILKALVYYNLCEYDRVQELLAHFQTEVTPARNALRKFKQDYALVLADTSKEAFLKNSKAVQLATAAYDDYLNGKLVLLPPMSTEIQAAINSQKDFANIDHHLEVIREEMAMLTGKDVPFKEGALAANLMATLKVAQTELRAQAGRFLLEQISWIEKELSSVIGQADIIKFEVVNAQKEEFEDKFRNPTVVETYDKLEQSYATESTLIFWPFNGEFWADELGYYRFTERGACRAKSEAK